MIGVCMTVLSIGHLGRDGELRVLVDKVLAVDALAFLIRALLSFMSMRTRHFATRYEVRAELDFLVGLNCWPSVQWCSRPRSGDSVGRSSTYGKRGDFSDRGGNDAGSEASQTVMAATSVISGTELLATAHPFMARFEPLTPGRAVGPVPSRLACRR